MPTRYGYLTVDVFTERAFSGNPVAVMLDAKGLSTDEMHRVAAECNYSESTFVFPPDDPSHTARVRIFTPKDEIPFAGHPNVGTAFVIAHLAERNGKTIGPTLLFEEGAGLVPVELLRDGSGRVAGAILTAPQPLTLANGALAALLAGIAPEPDAVFTFDIRQGVEMGRPSRLTATAEKQHGSVTRVRVGGPCVAIMEGAFAVETQEHR